MEFTHGIYIGARFSRVSEDNIMYWAETNRIGVVRENLHVTVFSSNHDGGVYNPSPFPRIRIPSCRILKSGPRKTFVVLAFDSPELIKRHEYAKRTLVSNYPGYTPHVTVSYSELRPVEAFTPVDFPLFLESEYIEPFSSNWSPK